MCLPADKITSEQHNTASRINAVTKKQTKNYRHGSTLYSYIHIISFNVGNLLYCYVHIISFSAGHLVYFYLQIEFVFTFKSTLLIYTHRAFSASFSRLRTNTDHKKRLFQGTNTSQPSSPPFNMRIELLEIT